MSNYREPTPLPPMPKKTFEPGPWILLVIAIVLIGTCIREDCKDKAAAAEKASWCCLKPKDWCRNVTECTVKRGDRCDRYETVLLCDHLCDEWTHTPALPDTITCPSSVASSRGAVGP